MSNVNAAKIWAFRSIKYALYGAIIGSVIASLNIFIGDGHDIPLVFCWCIITGTDIAIIIPAIIAVWYIFLIMITQISKAIKEE
jgi:hypothetical protein